MVLLDTNACIRVLNGTSAALIGRLHRKDPAEVCLSAIVKAELVYGARRSTRVAENLLLLERFFSALRSVPFDDLAAAEYGLIRVDLERSGMPIGPNDILLAATARAHGLTLVTHNTGEFSRVAGLAVEDWEAD